MPLFPATEPTRCDEPMVRLWSEFDEERRAWVTHREVEPITSYQVWFVTPTNLVETYEEAVAVCERCDFLPELCITPVPVAVTASGNYRRLD